jgi:hypothetical protein
MKEKHGDKPQKRGRPTIYDSEYDNTGKHRKVPPSEAEDFYDSDLAFGVEAIGESQDLEALFEESYEEGVYQSDAVLPQVEEESFDVDKLAHQTLEIVKKQRQLLQNVKIQMALQ